MIPLTIGTEKHSLPTSWGDVSVEKFFQLANEPDLQDVFKIISILLDIDYDTAIMIDAKYIAHTIVPMLTWLNDMPKLKELAMPERIKIGSKWVDPHLEIRKEPQGLKILLQSSMTEDKSEQEMITYSIAVYLFFKYYKCEYSEMKKTDFEDRLSLFQKLISQCSILEAYPVAGFFLKKSKKFRRLKPKYINLSIPRMRFQPV
ncbi:MAG TPA: hypothetical protein VJY62_02485 [Bacteroidia bacterium]|nr:hypothetical protein [Bacteroidia bacterium]